LREAEIEARLVRGVKEAGGLCYKFVSPGNPGVPDRLILLPGGRILFVELKTPGGKLSNIQSWRIQEMRERDADVRVWKGLEPVRAFLKEIRDGGGAV
jgi:hypothetical protein